MTQHTPQPDLAVVIPAWNERENLELLLPALREVLDGLGIAWEIVVADGGSTDGTQQAAVTRGARVVRQVERGYGGALLAGFAATTAPYLITMDADCSHRPVFIEELWRHREEAELLIASRYVAGGGADMGRFRRLLSHVLNRTYARALSLPLHDLSSGFRMYRRDTLRDLTLTARDFDILEEILIRVHARGWRIHEVPFHYTARGAGRSHARLFAFGWAYLKTLVRMWQLRNSVASCDYDHRAFGSPIPLQRYWQHARYRHIMAMVGRERAGGKPAILDVGCGSSRIIQALPDAVALDILLPKLRFLRGRVRRLVQASAFALPFSTAAFDIVICSEVIEHVPDSPEMLVELTRVLRPGGRLILGTPDYGRRLWWLLEWIYGKVLPGAYAHEHITHFTQATLRRRLLESGYAIQDLRYVGFCEMIFLASKTRDTAHALPSAPSRGVERSA
jgi:dolichol-phosphate mannosyltransferase